MSWLAGIPRDEIPWFPIIDADRCVKCGMCMNCGRSVYDWTSDGARVVRPYDCVVGCNTCANLCLGQCITFPPIEEVRKVYQQHKVWPKVKEELKKEGRIT